MADSSSSDQGAIGAGNGALGANTARQFALRQIYLKDMSFEAPNSPGILTESGLDPEVKLNLRTTHRDLGNGLTEVVLHLDLHALAGQRTLFLVEFEQAGTFLISGFSAEETRAIIGVACPSALFPYARETVSSIIHRGSFPPLILQNVDFAALFEQAQSKRDPGPAPAGKA
jgi:preprotein translocase subunit SecB